MTEPPAATSAPRIALDAEHLGDGLGRLVVAILDLVRQLLERQALRRVESGSLGPDEIERLGRGLLDLEQRFAELREMFGAPEDRGALPLDIVALDATSEE